MPRQSIDATGAVVYRTRLLTLRQASAFAAALRANARFTAVQVACSTRAAADSEARHYVTFRAANAERQDDARAREYQKRAGRAAAESAGYVIVADPDSGAGCYWLLSTSGETYQLTTARGGGESCSCPDYCFRAQRAGLPCKHLLALRAALDLGAPPMPAMPEPFGSDESEEYGDLEYWCPFMMKGHPYSSESEEYGDLEYPRGYASSRPAHLTE